MSNEESQYKRRLRRLNETLNRHSVRGEFRQVAKYVVVILAAAITLLPLYFMVSTSFKTRGEASAFPPTLFPHEITVAPYIEALNANPWVLWFFNTAAISISTVVAVLCLVTPAAYAVVRRDFLGKRMVYLIIVATLMLPGQIIALPLYIFFYDLGLINTRIGLVIAYSVFFSGFAFFLIYGTFQTLPDGIEEAARIAGVSEWKILLRIVLPLAKPGLATAGLFLFVFAWNEFFLALVFLQENNMYTFSIGLQFFRGLRGYVVVNQMFAISSLASLPVLLLFVVFQKQFVKGIVTGFTK